MAKGQSKIVAKPDGKTPVAPPIQRVEKLGRTISKPADIKIIKDK